VSSAMYGEPLIAWRTWNLTARRRRLRLAPVGDYRNAWPPRDRVRAVCARRRSHVAPDPACTCGVHASKWIAALQRARGPVVLGTVALWGRVIEHELGYRASFGYPQRLRLVCPICFWQRGVESDRPLTVSIERDGTATPFCVSHASTAEAIGRGSGTAVSAAGVEAALLSEYMIDLLPDARLAAEARAA
jgi:hypothetical protein